MNVEGRFFCGSVPIQFFARSIWYFLLVVSDRGARVRER